MTHTWLTRHRLGFSAKGFFAVLVVMLPNIFWAVFPPLQNPLLSSTAIAPWADWLENAARILLVISLLLVVPRENSKKQDTRMLVLSLVCLAFYDIFWLLYYLHVFHAWVYIGLAVFPSIYFISTALYLDNAAALVPAAVFGLVHIINMASSFLA